MNAVQGLFAGKYFGYIATAYGITFAVIAALILWIVITRRHRRAELERLEGRAAKYAAAPDNG